MPSYINTNIASLNSQRNLNTSQSALATSLQRLSSGLRINSARDDAAGMAISSRMTSQINGNNQASRNANDGISLAQTAEGDLAQIGTNLQRMRDLAVQSANATNSSTDRAALQSEVQQLAAEIDRVAQNSSFNGVHLLDGSFTAQNFQVGAGATAADQISISSITSARTNAMGSAGTTTAATLTGTATTTSIAAGGLTLNGIQVGASSAGALPGQSASSAVQIATAINQTTATSGVSATAVATTKVGIAPTAFVSQAANTFTVNGVAVGAIAAGGTVTGQGANVAAAINLISTQTGVTASANATTGLVTLNAADGRNININVIATIDSSNASVFTTAATLVANTGFANTASDTTWATAAATQAATSIGATINSVVVSAATVGTVLQTAQAFVSAFNAAAASTANAATLAGITAVSDANGVVSLTSNGTIAGMSISTVTGVGLTAATYAATHGTITLHSSNANGIVLSGGTVGAAGFTAGTTGATTVSTVAAVSGVDVSTAAGSLTALATIDGAIAAVNTSRANLGAFQNRFASVVTSLQTTSENLTASRSRIMDTDFAAETSSLTRNQILQQAGTAMLAQANQLPQNVLTLLR